MYKKFDIWLPVSRGQKYTLEVGAKVMEIIMGAFENKVLVNGIHRIGCAYRVQIETMEETAEQIKKLMTEADLDMEETRGFSAS